MSFVFNWPKFSENFYRDATQTLDNALNKGQKPPILADRINVKELDMGSLPPELEILEIGDLTKDRFRGIFRLTYAGDAYIELQTSVQANPLSNSKPGLDILPSPSVLFAAQPLVVPMSLRLSDLKLQAIIVLVISRQKGITLVFKNDPLQSVKVSSSFDSVGVIQGYIQRQIEGQLREVFRSDLPSVIHKLSQRWLAETTPTAAFQPAARIQTQTAFSHAGSTHVHSKSISGLRPSTQNDPFGSHKRSASFPRLPSDEANESVSDALSTYDPTYGLRPPASPPKHAPVLDHMSELWQSTDRGLGHMFDSHSTSPSSLFDSRPPSSSQSSSSAPSLDHELYPQDALSSRGTPLSEAPPASSASVRPPHYASPQPEPSPQPPPPPAPQRKPSPPPLLRNPATAPLYRSPLSVDITEAEDEDESSNSFHLNSARNDACAHISTLSHSFQTLSPFTKPLEHFTARSVPRGTYSKSQLGASASPTSDQPLRGQRKRHFKLGKSAAAPTARGQPPSPSLSQAPSSSGSDWSDYFPRQPATQLS